MLRGADGLGRWSALPWSPQAGDSECMSLVLLQEKAASNRGILCLPGQSRSVTPLFLT